MLKRILRKEFFITLFIKQNKWHKFSTLGHTLKLIKLAIKAKRYNMITACILHDIAKPLCAFQDNIDKENGTYSFTNHEELGYQIIKDWSCVSDYTKNLVRYHYLIRGMSKALEKNKIGRYNRMKRQYDGLDEAMIKDLKIFLALDDGAKK